VEDSCIPILMYHSISTSTNPRFKRWAVSPALFDEHLAYLRQNQYTPITVTELMKARTTGDVTLPTRPVILTFDDAYADFYENAFPALQRHRFVATLYVPTAYVGGTCSWLREEGETMLPMASWSQLAEMSAGGIECGGHSHGHVQMDAIPFAAANAEIRQCKALLEDHLSQEVLSFAYPHGWTSGSVKRMVHAAGYTSACAVKNMRSAPTDDPFELARLVVTGDTSVANFAQLLTRRVTPLEVALRDVARPIWRFVPRSKAWLRSYVPEAAQAAITR
jgi:O-antigen biosynthesis protein